MKKRWLSQMPITPGIEQVFCARDDIEYERFTQLSEENILQHIGNYDAVILGVAPFTDRIIEKATRLKIASRHGVGYDSVDVPAPTRDGHPMPVVGTANSGTVAEQALFFKLELAKRGVTSDRARQKERRARQGG